MARNGHSTRPAGIPAMCRDGPAGLTVRPRRQTRGRVRFGCRALLPVAELFDVCLPGDRLAPVPPGDAARAFIDAFKEPTAPLDFLSLRLGGDGEAGIQRGDGHGPPGAVPFPRGRAGPKPEVPSASGLTATISSVPSGCSTVA